MRHMRQHVRGAQLITMSGISTVRPPRDGWHRTAPNGEGGTGGGGGTGQGGTDGGGQPQTFTQADIDRVVSERLTRERAKFADYDDLKRKADEHDKAVDAQKSEHEKALDAARKETDGKVRSELLRERVLDKVEVAAAGKFADATDARLRLATRADEFVGKDGAIDAGAIGKAVEQLLKDAPHLAAQGVRKGPKPDPGQGARDGGTPTGKDAGLAEAKKRFGEPKSST